MWKEIIEEADAFLFDLDGTVVDSMWVWHDIDVTYFKSRNLEMIDTYQKEIEGLSFYETAVYTHDHYIHDVSVEDLMKEWNEMAYEHYANIVKPKEGVMEFLSYLKDSGKKLGIATSNSRMLCEITLKNNGIFSLFDSIHTGEEATPGKPAPDVYLNCAASLGADPSRCIVFEDLINGILAGKNAGMKTVAIHDDYSEDQWKEKCALADHSIMSYLEITDEILNKKS